MWNKDSELGLWTLDVGRWTLDLWPTSVLTLHSQPHKIPFPPQTYNLIDYKEVIQ